MRFNSNYTKKASPELCDWNAFRTNDNLQKKNTIEVKNRYDVLLNEEVSATPTERYTLFEKANTFAKDLLIPKKVKTKRSVVSDDPRVQKARGKVKIAYTSFANNVTPNTRDDLCRMSTTMQSIVRLGL